jgi:CDP-glucose 4,6-dehydratase
MEGLGVKHQAVLDRGMWRDRPVLVTGATGFLGAHLTNSLHEAGAEVVVLVRDQERPNPVSAGWRRVVAEARGDICDQALLERVLGEYQVRTVFHLAAQTQVEISNRNPVSTFESNVRGSWALLEACRRSPLVEQVLVASSDKAYGSQPQLPYTERMPLLAVNPYDVSKACADLLAASYHEAFGLPACVARCGNFFGPGDTNWNRLVPGSIRALLHGERPIVRSDGTLTRDYLYIEDAVWAYLRLAEAMAGDPTIMGEAFNFSTETPLTVLELLEMVRHAVGRSDLEPDVQATAHLEIQHQWLSAEKARTTLEWKPLYTMQEAMAATVDWYRAFLTGKQ